MTNGRVRVPQATGPVGDGSDGRLVRRAKGPTGMVQNPYPYPPLALRARTGTGEHGRAGGGRGVRRARRLRMDRRRFPTFSGAFGRIPACFFNVFF